MSDEKFPLPGSSYKELSKIIAAYATISGATAPGPVGQIAVVHETVVSRNNKFLVATGLIEGGQKKTCTALGGMLGRAIQHDQAEAISEGWRKVVNQTDFLQKIISAVRIRKGMEESALVSHIAFTSGTTKSAYGRAGAGAIIEILQLSGSIVADGSTLVASAEGDSMPSDSKGNDAVWTSIHSSRESGTSLRRSDRQTSIPSIPTEVFSDSRLTISLKISCKVDELEGLGTKLRKLVEDFSVTGATRENPRIEVDTEPLTEPDSSIEELGGEQTSLPEEPVDESER